EILRQHRFDLILASFPPASAVKLALLLHQATGVPLVLDFRDRWFGPGGYEPQQERSRQRHKTLERTAVGAATGIVTVSEPLAEALASEFSLDAGRILPILNGFEPIESPSTVEPPIRKTHRFVVAHVGTVIGRNRPDLLFKSLVGIKADLRMREVLFRFVGNLSRAYLSRAGLEDIVQSTGLLPRDRARTEMFGADALLLLIGSYVGRWGHNAKLFEYLQTGRPILCLEEAPGTSNDRRLLERHAGDRSFFAAVHNPDEIARSIGAIRAFCSGSAIGSAVGDVALEQYSRRHLAARLSEFLSRAVESTGPAN
ncbi:MAG: glycosyltransferase, partial [Planctomycetota bacterium]|nr:glycosyltransferase [Planctomycetota bacterium]